MGFECTDKTCAPLTAACNGRRDCGDNSDEQLCRQQSTMSDSADRDCPAPEYFKCADQCRCLPVSKLCDKVKDCPDGSDEVVQPSPWVAPWTGRILMISSMESTTV